MAKRTASALKLSHDAFVREYLATNGNATEAYARVYPKASRTTAAVKGWHLVRNGKIAAKIDAEWQKQLAKYKIDPDAVIGMMSKEATADMRAFYDANGKLLPPQHWPKDLGTCVEAVKLNADGTGTIKLASQSNARKFLLELSGRTRNAVADSIDHMADAIRADRLKHLKE